LENKNNDHFGNDNSNDNNSDNNSDNDDNGSDDNSGSNDNSNYDDGNNDDDSNEKDSDFINVTSEANAKNENEFQSFKTSAGFRAKDIKKGENTILSFYINVHECSMQDMLINKLKRRVMVIFWILLQFMLLNYS